MEPAADLDDVPHGDALHAQAIEGAEELIALARAWADGDPDAETSAALLAIVDAGDVAALPEWVGGALEFGTAGLRALVGAGPLRMNRAVVIRTTRGLADHLLEHVPGAATDGVVVGFDARHDSLRFARDTVAVLAAAGIRCHWLDTPQPTPLVAYAQKALGAAAAVVITASHNPADYNGYKVYVEDAAQIVPPTDLAIAAAIAAVGPAREVPLADVDGHPLVSILDDRVAEAYLAAIRASRPAVDGPDLRVAYTPLHGVGAELMLRALDDGGYRGVQVVASQHKPDPDFPTVPFPNPEEPGALDEALALADEVGADLVLANDPDADRLAVAVRWPTGGHRALTGNQIGILLADHLLRTGRAARPMVVTSIVSTPMLSSIAEAHGAHAEYTLTGFKWICAAARVLERRDGLEFVFGFEEALGSCVGTVVHDKDGIGAGVAFADLVRALARDGLGVADRLAELARHHGLWVSRQRSVTLPGQDGARRMADAMASLARRHPAELAGHAVRGVTDFRVGAETRPPWLGHHDLIGFDLDDGRAMIRPSGTEPKCKVYVDLVARVDGAATDGDTTAGLDARTRTLGAEADAVAAALARFAGLE